MKYEKTFTFLIFSSAIIVGLLLSEVIATLWLAKSRVQSVCPNWDIGKFGNSRGFSLTHAFYEPRSAIDHCQPEYKYTYNINELGFRDNKIDTTSQRILAIGDSFTFGFGVEDNENFPALMGAHNSGMWGNPFDIQLKAFQRNVALVKPDIVLWGIYPPHIITMMPGEWSKNIPGDRILLKAESTFLKKILNRISFQKLNELSLIKLTFKIGNVKELLFDGNNLVLHKDGYQTKEIILFDKNISTNKYTYSDQVNLDLPKDRDAVLLQMEEYFSAAKKTALDKRIKVLFFIIPSRLALRLRDGTANIAGYPNISIDPGLPSKLVSNSIINAGFSDSDILDLGLLPELQTGEWEKYYFKIDAHWNAQGHKLVANSLNAKLGLVSKRLP